MPDPEAVAADVAEAVEEAAREVPQDIVAELRAISERIGALESRVAATPVNPVPAIVPVQADPNGEQAIVESAERIEAAAETIAEAVEAAIPDPVEEFADDAEEFTDDFVEDVVPDSVERTAHRVEEATEIERVPQRGHVLFRKVFGRG